jgi:hypothetical protein
LENRLKLHNFIAVLVLPIVLIPQAGSAKDKYEFSDYKQILPRGAIAAITDPQYVSASEASINPNSYVLGVVIDGQARAYSLNILNHHEVVNDKIGDLAYAAVW